MHALLAAALAGMVVMPVAFAGASGSATAAKKQVKALGKRVAFLEGQQGPKTLPPSGPAGGDLTGSYPDPEIGPSKVGSLEIADGTVGRTDLGNDSISFEQIAPDAIGSSELKGAVAVASAGVAVAPGQTKEVTVVCPAGSRVLSGGSEWGGTGSNGASVISSSPTFTGNPNTTWVVQGRVDTGGTANTIFAEALCLAA